MKVHSGTYESSTDLIRTWALASESRYVCVANVHMTMETVDASEFKSVVNSADLVTSDGMPLVWMLKALGLKNSERVYGPELVLKVCEMAEREGLGIGLYGGIPSSLDSFTSFLAKKYPKLKVTFSWAPPFRPLTETEDQKVVDDLRNSQTKILFVGIGCPKQERWMHAHRQSIKAVQLGVGAAFDFHSGAIRQAPAWMGKSGLEWVFRFLMEPKRLWKRYVIHNPRFIVGACIQLLQLRLKRVAFFSLLPLLAALVLLSGSVIPELPTESAPKSNSFRSYWVSQTNPVASDSNPGTKEFPFRTISSALGRDLLQPGDTLLIESGVYAEALRPSKGGSSASSRVVIRAAPGHKVTITGADLFGKPTKLNSTLWVINNYTPLDHYGDDSTYKRDLIVADGIPLRPVFQRSELSPGTFFLEELSPSKANILINTGHPEAPTIQIGKRGSLFKPGNRWTGCDDPLAPGWFHLKNLSFIYAANQAQSGAVCTGHEGTLLDSVRVVWSNGVGIQVMGNNHELRNSMANHNGQSGINGTCTDCLLTGNETSFNNWVGHDPFWEAGGGKWIASQRVNFIYHRSEGNEGPGLWFDGDNEDLNVSYSNFNGNLAAGIFVELKSEAVDIKRVNISKTRRLDWAGSGILIQATTGVSVTHSRIEQNDGAGIWVRDDDRASSGFNRFLFNQFGSNGQTPGPDVADIQIDAEDITHLCSTRIIGLDPDIEKTSFLFEVAEPYELLRGSDVSHHACLVKY